MKVVSTKEELRNHLEPPHSRLRVLVPTMGALHRGHTSLIDLAGEQADEVEVVVSIFVNPTQFGPGEDYESYPRTREEDLRLCEEHGVDLVFAPGPDEMYRDDASVTVGESSLSRRLCGASRPGHFDGVCTVVAKLFLLVQPDVAVFGEKDYQQLAILRRMVRDLDFPIHVVGGPTVREADGLALSSRNTYLDESERAAAPMIREALAEGAEALAGTGPVRVRDVLESMRRRLESCPPAAIDYLEIVDAETLEPVDPAEAPPTRPGSWRILAAVRFGRTRLIDNAPAPPLVS